MTRVIPLASLDLVDPELRAMLDAWPTIALTHEDLPALRARELPLPDSDVNRAAVELLQIDVPGPEGAPPVPVRVYRPHNRAEALPCIFHIHGGGYVLGSSKELAPRHRAQVAELGCAIVTVDYRLAPETRFPGAIEDCYAALAWTFADTAGLGIDVKRIGVMGESAGGGFAAALALLARDRGDYPLAFQHLIYPMLDDRTCADLEPHPYAGEFIWTPHNNAFGWSALLGAAPGGADVSPYAAAARAKDLSGLPPAFISTGGLDLFIDEDIDYAKRLMRAGVPVELHVYPGGFHGFDLDPDARVAKQARADSAAALRRFLFG